jgi:hypothetical protein
MMHDPERVCAYAAVVVCAGDHPIAGDRLKRYLAIGASLANARAHKVTGGTPSWLCVLYVVVGSGWLWGWAVCIGHW